MIPGVVDEEGSYLGGLSSQIFAFDVAVAVSWNYPPEKAGILRDPGIENQLL